MLRINQNSSASGAKGYYSTADYYTEGQELAGRWCGEGARRLGLDGTIRQEDWDALCDNRNPATGETLTARQKSNRRIGYDFNFHVPKSVSILYGLSGDERILDAFRDAVGATMRDIEAEMKTRVRKSGRDGDRTTGNMVWGEFTHTTARPVDGTPDPHLHAHCFVFNSTWDDKEGSWKAGQFADLKRDAPYFEAVFHSRFAHRLAELGLPVERIRRGWEIAGLSRPTLEKFSRRTTLIEMTAKAIGISDADTKSELGATTRERKRKDLAADELRAEWASRLNPDESGAVSTLRDRVGPARPTKDTRSAEAAASLAIEHCFERNSVVPERALLADAMKRSFGEALPESVIAKVNKIGLLTADRDGRRMTTTPEVLDEERRMIQFARSGRGTCTALGDALYTIKRDWLNDGQRRAVRHVVQSTDRVTMIRGAAGTGKTAMMQEAVEAIESGGKRVFTFAPSAAASRGVLRQEGFAGAETVARLLHDEQMQTGIHGQVIWIDEAGLLGTRTMAQLFALAERTDARVILSGDRKQHGSVERGAALRLLEDEAGIVPAEIREIQRQRGDYKSAVQALSEGRIDAGFHQLDKLGWIREVDDDERYKLLANDYVNAVEQGRSALVVSPTHREGECITDEIRSRLKQAGRLGAGEHRLLVLENANLTEAERRDPVNYALGDVIVFHQNAKRYRKGQRIDVADNPIPVDQVARFQVYRPAVLPIAPGEVIRITRNAFTADGKHRLDNGANFTVKQFDAKGNMVLTNGWTIGRDFGHLAHGYCVTSHAAQGRTVDHVFIGESLPSFAAASPEQFYVSVSRGRQQATIYTSDKRSLLDAVSRADARQAATDLFPNARIAARNRSLQRLREIMPFVSVTPKARDASREPAHER